MEALLKLGLDPQGRVPPSRGYVWRNLSLDFGHMLTYFVGHEAHHRGQIVMVAFLGWFVGSAMILASALLILGGGSLVDPARGSGERVG